MSRFYLTTPIYYVNDRPHIGHAYATFLSDIIVSWYRMRGYETFFLTGTDENSQKNVEAAAAKLRKGKDEMTREEVQAYVDAMSAIWMQTWDSLGIRYDRFIRTTEADHIRGVERFIAAVQAKGDISKGTYRGWYCVGCEAFIPEKDVEGGMCPTHVRALERVEEENYFFRLSRYRESLLAHFAAHPDFVQPESRRNEILAYIRDHLEDVSISRPMRNWGIPFPGDASQAVYVWFDALTNYLTGVGYGVDDATFTRLWPAQVHLVGKDIIKFHAALWPAMLMSAGLPLPECIFATGFFTMEGKKMSKSLGNVVNPTGIADRYGTDALRYFFVKEIPFGGDGDFSEGKLAERYAADLQHGIGNFAARVLTMVEKYESGIVPAPGADRLGDTWARYAAAMEQLQPHEALAIVDGLLRVHDQYVEQEKPWILAKAGETDRLAQVLGDLAEVLRHLALLYAPFMPETSAKILTALGQDHWREHSLAELQRWGSTLADVRIRPLEHLFPERSATEA